MSMDTCHECGNEYKRIATHWSTTDCPYKPFTEKQHEIVKGLLMGDGCLRTTNKYPHVQMQMTSEKYLLHLSNEIFPTISGRVNMKQTAENSAKSDRKTGFNPRAKTENYSNIYNLTVVSHPELQRYVRWYRTGEKVFPKNLELTPECLKHYFAGDGSLCEGKYARITLCNEHSNKDKINKMFDNVGLSDFYWADRKRKSRSGHHCSIKFTLEGTNKFYDYIGEPVPGLEYRWPEDRR